MSGINDVNPEILKEHLTNVPIGNLASNIDALTLFFGDPKPVSDAVLERILEIKKSNDYRIIGYSAGILATQAIPEAIELFELASSLPKASPSEQYFALHRLATAQIKRFNDPQMGLETLNKAIEHIAPEHHAEISLYNNLKCLALLKMQQPVTTVLQIIQEALVEIDLGIQELAKNSLYDGRLYRYRNQIVINKAQLLHRANRDEEAKGILFEALSYCYEFSPEYITEVLGALALYHFKSRQYEEAITLSHQMIPRLCQIGSTKSIIVARKVLFSSLLRLGQKDQAEKVFNHLQNDPLGLRDSY